LQSRRGERRGRRTIEEENVSEPRHRVERDGLGEREVPSDAYWGINTLRALENFPITGQPISSYPHLVRAMAAVKRAAARSNADLGLLVRQTPRPSRAHAGR